MPALRTRFVLLAAAAISAGQAASQAADLYAPNWYAHGVNRYDTETGTLVQTYFDSAIDGAMSAVVGSDNQLHVVGNLSRNLVSFDLDTGATTGVMPFEYPYNNAGDTEVGPDGDLYICRAGSSGLGYVYRYDGQTGNLIGRFTQAQQKLGGIAFGPDGDLYMTDNLDRVVYRYDGQTGARLGVFASTQMYQPEGLAFGPDGNLYVADASLDAILRFDGTTGEFINYVDSGSHLDHVWDIAFDPDGLLYASATGTSSILRYDPQDDSYEGVFASPVLAYYMDIVPEPSSLLLCAIGAVMGLRRR